MDFLYKFLLILLIVFVSIFIISFIVHFITISRREHKHIQKPDISSTYKRRGKLRRLLIDFPAAIARDILNRNPNEFRESGLHVFCGEQGSGKTVSMVQRMYELKQRYPKVKILTNFDCDFADGTVTDWRDIVFKNNGVEGIIIALDEIQNWFSTAESKDFPPEMLQEITQQRKQRKMIIATSQRFNRTAKPIREQVKYLYEPFTVLGSLTFVRCIKPFIDDDGQLDRKRSRRVRTYFYVHSDFIRNSFDTFQKIERQANGGYIGSRFSNSDPPKQNINVDITARKRLR